MSRRTRKTRLIYCEGAHDKAFLDCVKSVYKRDVCNVDIRRGTGGNQVHLAEEAVKRGRSYDAQYLKIDGDRDSGEMADTEEFASKNHLVILKTTPCTERLLINIVEPNKRIASWGSARLKNYFEANYIPRNKRADSRAYKAVLTKKLLDEARERLPELKELIDIF